MSNFISLHNQTTYSLLDSLCSIPDLFKKAKDLNQTAIAITDHGSIASAWEALNISKSTGIKLIIGVESYFTDDASNIEPKLRHLILLAKNAVGYRNLLTLNKKSFDQGKVAGNKNYPILDWELLNEHKEGLICLTACGNGIISQLLAVGNFEKAEETLSRLKEMFGENLGIEILANNMKRGASPYFDEIDQAFLNRKLIKLAEKHEIKVVATCNTHYINKDDYETHDVLLAVGSKQPKFSNFRLKYNVNDFYLKSEQEMISFFSRNYGEEKAKEFVFNSRYFSELCEFPDWIDPKYSNPSGKELPVFPVKDELDYQEFLKWVDDQDDVVKSLSEDKQYLRFKCFLGLQSYSDKMNLSEDNIKIYSDRIDEELDVLEYHGFSSYILIVNDYLSWCKINNIPTGPGRGSIGGSLIAFLIGIHEADPIQYNLIFARFHNKEKKSYPDIDCDIAPSGRERLQNYLKNKYGENNVAHVSNLNRITPKVYIKDIARACELGGSKEEAVKLGNDVADCVPAEIKSIEEAYSKIPLFAEYCKKYPELMKFKSICNQGRANSTHAGGLIISERPMTGLVPLRKDKEGALSVEYDKDKAEENGLVKMDILGLSTLDIISKANELIILNGKEVPTIDYNIYDEESYNLLSKGDTFCVFQLGTSGGTIDLCKKVKPKSIEDISHINALARPSARDMREAFIKAKNGKTNVVLLHPTLKRAFENTFGLGLYEESLMFLAQDVAGWTLHEADKLRKLTKAKGKHPEKVVKWRQEFIDGCVQNNVSQIIATRIWDEVIELFQGYGFNKSIHHLTNVDIYCSAGNFIETKHIENVKSGDYVKSRDENSKHDIFVKVINNHDHGILPVFEIELDTGEKIKCTMNHKFRVKENGEMLSLRKIIKENLTIVVNIAEKISGN